MRISKKQQLTEFVQHIIDDGGEGVILRKPDSLYEHGRSKSVLKLKASRGDQEALVVDIVENEDEKESLLLQLADGNTISVLTPSPDVCSPPEIGDIVMFSYENYTKYSLPVDPKIKKIRTDISWEEVLFNWKQAQLKNTDSSQDPVQKQFLNESSKKPLGLPPGYWQGDKRKKMRQFCEKFAKINHFDPLVAENWYSIPAEDFRQFKGGNTVINAYGGSFVKALINLFPEIGLDKLKFVAVVRWYWTDIKNRRAFMEHFATEKGFDPLSAEQWYKMSAADMKSTPHGSSLLANYTGSLISALLHLFPDVKFEVDKFSFLPRNNYWADRENQRKHLDKFAQDNEFDPLIPQNWYNLRLEVLRSTLGFASILKYHNNSVHTALIQLYPELNLDLRQFYRISNSHWTNKENRRDFFIEFAKKHNFDPLVPQNWYKWNRTLSYAMPKSGSVLRFYKGSHIKALVAVFPDIGLQFDKFPKVPQYNWADASARRAFFENFARDRGLDPLNPQTWYSIKAARTKSRMASVLQYHRSSLSGAILDLFPEIGLELAKFPKLPANYWKSDNNKRELLSQIMTSMGLDPLVAEHWYQLPTSSFYSFQRVSSILKYYGSLNALIIHIFPNIDPKRLPKFKPDKTNNLSSS